MLIETKIPTLNPSWRASYSGVNSISSRNLEGEYNNRPNTDLTKYFNAGILRILISNNFSSDKNRNYCDQWPC